ncbi:hypothetical protein Tcan_16169 [Toxocara canis]|uniref:Uncharacterized protein n=1 Tax=Toxocara canis TaxID=6265 RepID=A0A0B2VN88_TOXCA|nr:hypothetical protein Tcan_16169 [Toxocara canis]
MVSIVARRRIAIDALMAETVASLHSMVARLNIKWDEVEMDETYRVTWIDAFREHIWQIADRLAQAEFETVESIKSSVSECLPEVNKLRSEINLPPFSFRYHRPGSIHAYYALERELERLRSLKMRPESSSVEAEGDAAMKTKPEKNYGMPEASTSGHEDLKRECGDLDLKIQKTDLRAVPNKAVSKVHERTDCRRNRETVSDMNVQINELFVDLNSLVIPTYDMKYIHSRKVRSLSEIKLGVHNHKHKADVTREVATSNKHRKHHHHH